MARKFIAELGPGLVLAPGYILRVTALNPTTGALVTGVSVSDVAVQIDDVAGDDETETFPELAPLFAYTGPT